MAQHYYYDDDVPSQAELEMERFEKEHDLVMQEIGECPLLDTYYERECPVCGSDEE